MVLPPAERSAPTSSSQVESRKKSDVWGSWRGGTTSSQDPRRGDSSGGFQQVHHPQQFSSELQPDSSANPENRQKKSDHPAAPGVFVLLMKASPVPHLKHWVDGGITDELLPLLPSSFGGQVWSVAMGTCGNV